MKNSLSRRELLKLAPLVPLAYLGPRLMGRPFQTADNPKAKNVLIIVFDAWSARHISLYGYERNTTPNINRLAEKAVVYHNHTAAAPWTVPGTGSLLTGVYPWTHRGFTEGQVIQPYDRQNLFSEFNQNGYYTFGYSHNPFVDKYLTQFESFEDEHIPKNSLYLNNDPLFQDLFSNDDAFLLSRNQIIDNDHVTNSLFLPPIVDKYVDFFYDRVTEPYKDQFPKGVPSIAGGVYRYLLEDSIQWLIDNLPGLPQPFLGYFHFYPPHAPYTSRQEFLGSYLRDWAPVRKPQHLFTLGESWSKMKSKRARYDEYIQYVDAEFGRLMDDLEASGQLDDTWVILTSDHGELFERGVIGHATNFMYEAVLNIPLVIFEPQRQSRLDIYDRTSAIDVLPTLLQATGHQPPSWTEGNLLPYFSPESDTQRDLFAIQPRHSEGTHKMREGTLVLYKENYKLIYYFGHEEIQGHDPYFELYDIAKDPEELNNLYPTRKSLSDDLFNILSSNLEIADRAYKR